VYTRDEVSAARRRDLIYVTKAARMITGIVDRCLEVTLEVWSRRDQEDTFNRSSTQFSSLSSDSLVGTLAVWEMANESHKGDNRMSMQCRVVGGKYNSPTTSQSPAVVPIATALVSSMHNRTVVRKLRHARSAVAQRLHWLGVMRDWNWESKYAECALLKKVTEMLTGHQSYARVSTNIFPSCRKCEDFEWMSHNPWYLARLDVEL
jgi:hypothetical protein